MPTHMHPPCHPRTTAKPRKNTAPRTRAPTFRGSPATNPVTQTDKACHPSRLPKNLPHPSPIPRGSTPRLPPPHNAPRPPGAARAHPPQPNTHNSPQTRAIPRAKPRATTSSRPHATCTKSQTAAFSRVVGRPHARVGRHTSACDTMAPMPTIAFSTRCTECSRMHGPGECRIAPRGVVSAPTPAAVPAARAEARQVATAPRPGRVTRSGVTGAAATVPGVTPAAVALPPEVAAHALALAGSQPLADWVASLILRAKPPRAPRKSAAERQRESRARRAKAAGGKP
jgi:hypothetical protein